jgi:hypothetical protein
VERRAALRDRTGALWSNLSGSAFGSVGEHHQWQLTVSVSKWAIQSNTLRAAHCGQTPISAGVSELLH